MIYDSDRRSRGSGELDLWPLWAFADNELSATERAATLDWLANDREAAARVADFRAQKAALMALFGDPREDTRCIVVRRRTPWWRHACVAASCRGVGVVLRSTPGWVSAGFPADQPVFAKRADIAYAVSAPEHRHPVEVTAANEDHLDKWSSMPLPRPLPMPSLREYGYPLVGSQMLHDESGPARQFMYPIPAKAPLTLHVAAESKGATVFRLFRDGTRSAFFWVSQRVGFALTGQASEAPLRSTMLDVFGAPGTRQKPRNRRWFETPVLDGFRSSDHPASWSSPPAAGWQATARTLLRALALTCLIFSSGALAQSTSPLVPASSGTSARCASAATSVAVSAELDQFRCLTAGQQAASLRMRIENHTLSSLTGDQILSLMDAMKPEAFVEYARSEMVPDGACEYRMFRQERVLGRWPDRPDHMVVRYQDIPRKVYAKWLPDGDHAGQELLYDETTDRDSIFGHLGGSLHFVSGKIAIDGPLARTQSRHSVRDLGLQFIARIVEHDARSFREEGLTERPTRIELVNAHGMRLLSWTWIAPSGPPAHYAQRVRLLFDLQHPWPRGEAAWDDRGRPLELIEFEDVVPHQWSETTFDRHNPEYDFQ